MAPFISQSPIPSTPTRHSASRPDAELNDRIFRLCSAWPLGLQPKEDHSPSKSQRTKEDECLFLIKWCSHKKVLEAALAIFTEEAEVLYSGWVRKPKAERGVIPKITRNMPKPVSKKERIELLDCLIDQLQKQKNMHPANVPTPRSSRTLNDRFPLTTPIPFPLTPRVEIKRSREGLSPDPAPAKKAKAGSSEFMPPPPSILSRMDESQGFNASFASYTSRSANTSFAASETSSVFSRPPSFLNSTMTSTQETIPADDISPYKTQENVILAEEDELPVLKTHEPAFTTLQDDKYKSSDYGASSSFERAVLNTSFDGDTGNERDSDSEGLVSEKLSQNLREVKINNAILVPKAMLTESEREFLDGLEGIFPGIPLCLQRASIYVTYEITRVFLHTGASLQHLDAPISKALEDYETLWAFLKCLPQLQGLSFPERCAGEVWKFAIENLRRGSHSVVLAGHLLPGTDTEPNFRLRLDAMKIDHSHRLGRRLGNDRFLEICLPSLTDRKLPKPVLDLVRGSDIFYDWLVDTEHCILGRKWQPFYSKPKERKSRKKDAKDLEAEATFRLYFFAVDGNNFTDIGRATTDQSMLPMSIPTLLNEIVRPIKQNSEQSYLKLFSRTTLALSRNRDTILLTNDQIRFRKEDILCNREVMNDGAGRISLNLANQVRLKLGLTYLPSAFQGRLGAAKGLWVVDSTTEIGEDWIEVYPSQQKWSRDHKPGGTGVSDDWSHRTFEVLKWSGPLKSADLNTQFLPLLVAQSVNARTMKSSLAQILKEGLANEVTALREAFEHPQALRKWVRDIKSSTSERLKYGAIPFRAGMPTSTEERINVMLDAGFSPKTLNFLYEQAKNIFQGHCDVLEKKLNITVGKSAYAYMVPDFWGVLEPDEVYIDFSSFTDNDGFTGAFLHGDLLVARSPAHFVSDIQKVKSVVKAELMGLKDVIVFSTKGNPSLASKLSGGDYDGDIAWVCWEDSIVNNFTTADIPPAVDLVKEGYIRKDSTTYKELVKGCSNPTSLFLKKAFAFNMRQSMLGICTNYKEKVCYTQKSVDTFQTRYLSQLLSDLVDAPKQGFIFDDEAFQKFKDFINVTVVLPKYMSGDLDGRVDHILDHLMVVARQTIKAALNQFWHNFKSPDYWDKDLTLLYNNATAHATNSKEWKDLLTHLRKELMVIKNEWGVQANVGPKQKEKFLAEFPSITCEFFDKFHAIRPHVDTPFTQALCLSSGVGANEELSPWSLLKASTFFCLYSKNYVPNVVWWIAGRQLLKLKADACQDGLHHVTAPHMYIIQRPDNAIIRRLLSDGQTVVEEESGSVRNVEELEDLYDE